MKDKIINQIVKLILDNNYSNLQLLDYLSNNYGYKQSYSYFLIRKARKKINDVTTNLIKDNFNKQLLILEEIYNKMLEDKEYKIAFQYIKELNKLLKK